MKKTVFFLLIAAALILLPAVIWFSGIATAYFFPSRAEFPQAAQCEPTSLAPGDTAKFSLTVTLPADEKIATAAVNGNGIISFTPEISPLKWRWNRRSWKISGSFRVIDTGNIEGIKIYFSTRKIYSSRPLKEYSATLPQLTSQLDNGELSDAELLLADEIPPPQQKTSAKFSKHWYWAIPAVLLLLGGIGYRLWRRSRQKSRQWWEIALDDIEILRLKVEAQEISPETGFARLCDLLRNYLENHCHFPASRQTTAEFMAELLRETSQLPESSKNFLSRFLATADLIKFARQRANNAAFNEAAQRAEEFIRTTLPEVTK